MDITGLTVHELQEKIAKKELSATEITKAYIDRINAREKDVNFEEQKLLRETKVLLAIMYRDY